MKGNILPLQPRRAHHKTGSRTERRWSRPSRASRGSPRRCPTQPIAATDGRTCCTNQNAQVAVIWVLYFLHKPFRTNADSRWLRKEMYRSGITYSTQFRGVMKEMSTSMVFFFLTACVLVIKISTKRHK